MISKSDQMIRKLAEIRKEVNDKITKGPERLKGKDKDKLSKIRNTLKRNSKK